MKASLVIADPPWYGESIRSFLWAACQLCAPGGYLLVSLPPAGTRPGITHEWAQTLGWAQQLGLAFLRLEPAALPYVTPPFERNALKAEGLYTIPDAWRRGNLAVFLYTHQATIPRPLADARTSGWRKCSLACAYVYGLSVTRILESITSLIKSRNPSLCEPSRAAKTIGGTSGTLVIVSLRARDVTYYTKLYMQLP